MLDGVLFKDDEAKAIADGRMTVAFRDWSAPRAKTGSVHRVRPGLAIAILSVEQADDGRWRVEFRRTAEPAPKERSRMEIATRLDAMRWSRDVLELIANNRGVAARVLAASRGDERLAFKANVRKLKALGLTRSLETGYEITALGRSFLRD